MSIAIPGQCAAILSGITSPRQVPGLLLWLDAAAITPVADGTALATWADRSGVGNDATQATGTKQPLYKVNIQNGLPGLLFDGADDYYVCNGPAAAFSGADTPGTIVAAIKHASVAATNAYFSIDRLSQGAPIWALRQSGNATNLIKRDDASALKQTSGGVIGATAARIISAVAPGTTASVWLDGTAVSAGTDVDVGTITLDVARVGARENGGAQVDLMNGYIFELLVWPRALADGERKAIERYLGKKWAVVVA